MSWFRKCEFCIRDQCININLKSSLKHAYTEQSQKRLVYTVQVVPGCLYLCLSKQANEIKLKREKEKIEVQLPPIEIKVIFLIEKTLADFP